MATFLVHGTFVDAADWPALKAALIETTAASKEFARFEEIEWTGRNKATARQVAVDDLFLN